MEGGGEGTCGGSHHERSRNLLIGRALSEEIEPPEKKKMIRRREEEEERGMKAGSGE